VVKGIQNSQFAELVDSDLQEGAEVIIGSTGGRSQAGNVQQNPFGPQRMPGMGRRGGF
jgi:hypothetical protein